LDIKHKEQYQCDSPQRFLVQVTDVLAWLLLQLTEKHMYTRHTVSTCAHIQQLHISS